MKHLSFYEKFTESEREDLIENNLTYIRKFDDFFVERNLKCYKDYINPNNGKIIEHIKKYDIKNFIFNDFGDSSDVYFDKGFIKLLSDYCKTISKPIITTLNIIIDKNKLNQIDLMSDLPDYLIGLGIGYRIYKMIIKKHNYISSYFACSKYAKNVWYKLLCDSDLYVITSGEFVNYDVSKGFSFAINKKYQILP